MCNFPFLFISVLMAVLEFSHACCERKPSLGCCGNGPCNIFCCNCDDGCNVGCEAAHCNTAEWVACSAVVAGCGAVCATDPSKTACAACMGGSYGSCMGCFGRRLLREKVDSASLDFHFPMSNKEFNEIADMRIHEEHLKTPDFDRERFLQENKFSAFDKDGDGYVSADEAKCNS